MAVWRVMKSLEMCQKRVHIRESVLATDKVGALGVSTRQERSRTTGGAKKTDEAAIDVQWLGASRVIGSGSAFPVSWDEETLRTSLTKALPVATRKWRRSWWKIGRKRQMSTLVREPPKNLHK